MSAKYGKDVLAVQSDVRDPAAMEDAVKKTIEKFGKIDILICGAAGNFLAPAEKLTAKGFKTVVEIDLLGTFNTIKAVFPHLKASQGCIINISATLQYLGNPYQIHASSAKAGVDAMTRTMAVEWGKFGIRVNGIAPGPIASTEGMRKLTPPGYEGVGEAVVPMKRFGSITDIEHAALFLVSCCDIVLKSHFITCSSLLSISKGRRLGQMDLRCYTSD